MPPGLGAGVAPWWHVAPPLLPLPGSLGVPMGNLAVREGGGQAGASGGGGTGPIVSLGGASKPPPPQTQGMLQAASAAWRRRRKEGGSQSPSPEPLTRALGLGGGRGGVGKPCGSPG